MPPRVTFLVLSALLAAFGGCRRDTGRARHLVLITVDTLRADRLGCYGNRNDASPFLDELAGRGVRFERAYAQRAMTLPSMTTFFTSKYPIEHGVVDNKKRVPDSEVLLAERLRDAGFHTFALNATHVLAPDSNISQGFARNEYLMFGDESRMTRKAERYIERRFGAGGRREFLWIHFMNPHKPYAPPEPFRSRFTSADAPGSVSADPASLDRVYVDGVDLPPDDLDHVRGVYDGTVAFVDSCVERIVGALEKKGVLDDTLLVFTADHGEELYDHNRYFWHANSIYGSGTHIPLVVVQPGTVPEGRVVAGLVEATDFLPTVLAWLGVEDGDGTFRPRGRDLSAVLLGERDDTGRAFVLHELDVDAESSEDGRSGTIFALRDAGHLLIANPDGLWPDFPPREGSFPIARVELYDTRSDPLEREDVAAKSPDLAAKLERVLLDRVRRLRSVRLEDSLDEERRRRLEQLGYLQPGRAEPPRKGSK